MEQTLRAKVKIFFQIYRIYLFNHFIKNIIYDIGGVLSKAGTEQGKKVSNNGPFI